MSTSGTCGTPASMSPGLGRSGTGLGPASSRRCPQAHSPLLRITGPPRRPARSRRRLRTSDAAQVAPGECPRSVDLVARRLLARGTHGRRASLPTSIGATTVDSRAPMAPRHPEARDLPGVRKQKRISPFYRHAARNVGRGRVRDRVASDFEGWLARNPRQRATAGRPGHPWSPSA